MKSLVYIGLALVAILAVVALGGEADSLPYLGIAIIAILIFAWFKK